MSDLNTTLDAINNAVSEAIEEMATQPAAKAPKPKADKPKAAPKAKAKAEDDAPLYEAPKAEPKPEPLMVDGFELKEGADVAFLSDATAKASEAIASINRKDADLLSSYLTLGMFQSAVVGLFKSTKVYGQYVAAKVPASQALDPALRSNCKWLYQALNEADHEASDILAVLGVNRIEDFKSGNPTVIRREYKAAKELHDVKAKAEAEGKTVEEMEAEEEANEKAAKEAAKAEAKRVFAEYVAFLGTKLSAKFIKTHLENVLVEAASGKDGAKVIEAMADALPFKDETPAE